MSLSLCVDVGSDFGTLVADADADADALPLCFTEVAGHKRDANWMLRLCGGPASLIVVTYSMVHHQLQDACYNGLRGTLVSLTSRFPAASVLLVGTFADMGEKDWCLPLQALRKDFPQARLRRRSPVCWLLLCSFPPSSRLMPCVLFLGR